MRAVVIGAGRIGCGLAAEALERGGYEVTIVARDPAMVAHLNLHLQFRVRLVEGSRSDERAVEVRRALRSTDIPDVAEAIAQADVVAVSVGVESLGAIAHLIAAGLKERTAAPLNVIAYENAADAGKRLRDAVLRHLPDEFPLDRHGFSSAVIERAVSRRVGALNDARPVCFVGDPSDAVHVDGRGLRAPLPGIPGMVFADDLSATFERKLFVFSAGHATTAYLGYLKGYRYIHAAIRDPEIREAVLEAMREGQRGLESIHGEGTGGGEDRLEVILRRFENAALNDPVTRVGRDPGRKLGPHERLLGAATLAERGGVRTAVLPLAAAAALCFAAGDPSGASPLAIDLARSGPGGALREFAALDPDGGLCQRVADAFRRFALTWRDDSPLLRLTEETAETPSGEAPV